MINANILKNAVHKKIETLAFHAIVNECFLRGLPFNKKDISKEDRKFLIAYNNEVMESLIKEDGKKDAFSYLVSAMESTSDPYKKQFLSSIYNICTEAADCVAERVCKESRDKDISLEEILSNAGMNEDEVKEFNENIKTLEPSKIGDEIQKKVIDTIKSEQKEHQESEELNQKLKEMIGVSSPNDDISDETFDEEELDDEDIEIDEEFEDSEEEKDDSTEEEKPASEGFIKAFFQKRKKRKLSIKEIKSADDKTFASLAAELIVAEHKDYLTKILRSEDQILEAFRYIVMDKIDPTGRTLTNKIEPKIFAIELGAITITVVVYTYIDDSKRKTIISRRAFIPYYESKEKEERGYVHEKTTDANGNITFTTKEVITKQAYDPGFTFQENKIQNFSVEKAKAFHWDDQFIAKKTYQIYDKLYKPETTEATESTNGIQSWHTIRSNPTDSITPISLFGKLNDFALEAVLSTKEFENSEIPYSALRKATFDSPIEFIYTEPSLERVTESLIHSQDEQEQMIAIENIGSMINPYEQALLISTIIYTVLETLKTMNIYSPSYAQIKGTVDKRDIYNDSNKIKLQIAYDQLSKKINSIKNDVKLITDRKKASSVMESINNLQSILDNLKTITELQKTVQDIYPELNKCKLAVESKLNSSFTATEALIKEDTNRAENLINQFNYMNHLYGNNKSLDLVDIHYDSTATESQVNLPVQFRDAKGNIIVRRSIPVDLPKEYSGAIEGLLRIAYAKSDFNKKVRIIDHGRSNKTEYLA